MRAAPLSHPAWGAWIETQVSLYDTSLIKGRTPPGVRGLKRYLIHHSHNQVSRTPPGVRGLKHLSVSLSCESQCRTPPGVRGLKLKVPFFPVLEAWSHPAWGAWIETPRYWRVSVKLQVAPCPGCVD